MRRVIKEVDAAKTSLGNVLLYRNIITLIRQPPF
ncbi:unnamed protein product [Acanthoscelides obtectus]|uniref:Uncharacterized protein n=1 Tax=Acanthoscelides obtectus TaxID=200917 RepID=A0A9P0M7U9_ACAOB|nr:unnamed protein product [Acanthoscelides obtectus]CAH2013438.1 unnamed protein product [Acanthoscelides obtectus]CAK1627243.1 hypothetical protein AOBTE_LOCUS4426 [Acanthoscelides obtectus]CAK1627425.1 hypothetical protein AOBTE_LOCUS4590 [Acanthoscelides obtectus]